VHVGTPQLFGTGRLADGSLTSGGPARKIVPWFLTMNALVGHGRHIGAAGGAGAHDNGDLRNSAATTGWPG